MIFVLQSYNLLTKIIDQSFRPHDPERVADRIDSLLEEYGIPDFFCDVKKLLILMFVGLGKHFPTFAVPKMIEQMRDSSSRAIIPGETKALRAHLHLRRKQNIRMNIYHLGEVVLGEEEAAKRMLSYLRDMEDPDINIFPSRFQPFTPKSTPWTLTPFICISNDFLGFFAFSSPVFQQLWGVNMSADGKIM